MRTRTLFAASVAAAALILATGSASTQQGQLPRPGQLPPAGGQMAPPRGPAAPPAQAQPQPQRGQQGQPPQAAAKPYKAVAISAPPPVADPSFEAFRKQLAAAAEKKDRKALGGLVVAQGFFWMGEKGDKADKRKPGIDNLAKAIQLDSKDGPGWEALAGYASDPTGTPFPNRKDTICAPADPNYNAKELEDLAKATGTQESDWGYPTQPGVEMRASAQPNAPVVEKLGMHFIRVMPDAQGGGEMIQVVAPSGKTGFIAGDAINPLGNDQMCYTKDGGGWKIVGYIGGDQ